MSYEGRIQTKLRALLLKEGLDVDFFVISTGYYRSSPYADCHRWEAWSHHPDPNIPNLKINLVSWDTMTDCARYGFKVIKDEPFYWEIFAKLPARQKSADPPLKEQS